MDRSIVAIGTVSQYQLVTTQYMINMCTDIIHYSQYDFLMGHKPTKNKKTFLHLITIDIFRPKRLLNIAKQWSDLGFMATLLF